MIFGVRQPRLTLARRQILKAVIVRFGSLRTLGRSALKVRL
jgi:hypothetical protein